MNYFFLEQVAGNPDAPFFAVHQVVHRGMADGEYLVGIVIYLHESATVGIFVAWKVVQFRIGVHDCCFFLRMYS